MNSLSRRLLLLITTLSLVTLSACGGDDDDDNPPAAPAGNVVQVAAANNLTVLGAAVTKAGLVAALSDSSATLTVFAPTDAAFGDLATALGYANATALVDALPAATLATILKYHVLPKKIEAGDLAVAGGTQDTLDIFEGSPATVSPTRVGGLSVDDAALTTATVTKPNVLATNGYVNVIDKVLIPPGVFNIVQMATFNADLSSLVAAVVKANLQSTLSGAGPLTVFAPNNAAFKKVQTQLDGFTVPQLTQVLTYHVLPVQLLSDDFTIDAPVVTAEGDTLTIVNAKAPAIKDKTTVNGKFVTTDVRASNGVIHVIDKVLVVDPILQAPPAP